MKGFEKWLDSFASSFSGHVNDESIFMAQDAYEHGVRQAQEEALHLILLLRSEADLKQGCTKETAELMGKFLRGEKLT
jgi:hypothetical protein